MKKPKPQKNETPKDSAASEPQNDFLIVGIGASAGGVQALKTFFENVPANSNAAYVVILHLSPDHDSQLAQILQSVSRIPVTQVTEKVHIEPNHVYVVPPNESLSMQDGHIVVSPIHTVEERRAPVDIFFRTLAESHCARAVAVVLSGTGANGSMGIKRIKENGGAAFVQNPREAEFSEMPRNSIATELVDEILNVAEIPQKIAAYQKNLGKILIPIEPENREEEQQSALREIFTQLRVRTGHDFANYKRPTVLRRIERRLNVRELSDLPAYAAYLKGNLDETNALLKDLLISVTNFFRDKEAFGFLEREVVPKILHGKKSGDAIRVWIAGCATGEEAYSLAMLLAEKLTDRFDAPAVQIFATDIDEQAIAAARGGFYTLNDAADVSPERLRRFFTEEKGGFRIRRELREMILFANHNLLKDPPFSQLDLATCRNLLIYFNGTAQERVLETFHFALKPGAFLFLGTSESIDGAGDLYTSVSREQRVFQSRQTTPRVSYPVPDLSPSFSFSQPATALSREIGMPPRERQSYGDLHQEILEQYAPPSLVINENFDIVHVSAKAGRYLQISGEPSHNLFKLIRPELRLDISTAVYQAVQRQTNVVAENIKVNAADDRAESVRVSVRPVLRLKDETARGFILIVFEQTDNSSVEAEAVFTSNEPAMLQLEEALLYSQSQYRHTVEQAEVQAEELKASNEELQAINEELRSATEELETGKEELQSVNEELVTVNQELKIKIEELSQLVNDFQNLMNSTNIGTIFLDRNFRVKLFTPAAAELFKLIPSDVGRELSDITHRLEYQDLIRDVETVLSKLQPVEREVRTTDGKVYLMQITPYRTSEDRISGIVVTFVNITVRKQAEESLSESAQKLERQTRVFDTTLSGIADFAYVFDRDGRFVYSNRPLLDLLDITAEEIAGKNFFDLGYPTDLAARLQSQIQHVFETGETLRDETPFTSMTGAGGFYEYIFNPVIAADGTVESVAGSTRDITWHKRAEANLAFLSDFSHSLVSLAAEREIVESFGEKINRLTGAAVCAFFEINEESDEAETSAEWHLAENFSLAGKFNIPELVSDEFRQLMSAGETVVVRDINEDSRAKGKKQLAAFGIGSFVNVPLIRGGEWKFVLGVYHAEKYDWRADEINLLTEAANRIWTKLERLRSEQAARESEERLRQLIKNLPGGAVFIVDQNLRYQLADGESLAATGFAPEDYVGKTIFEALPPESAAEYEVYYRKALAGEAFTHEHKSYGGTYITRGAPLRSTADGQVYGVIAVSYDISDRKQAEVKLRESEERFRAMFEQANFGIVQLDFDERFLAVNPGYCQIVGYTEAELRKMRVRDLTLPEDFAIEEDETRRLLAGEIAEYSIEKRYIHKNGSIVWATMTATLVRGEAGEPLYVLSLVEDITTRKQAETALGESEERFRLLVESVIDYAIFAVDEKNRIVSWNAGAEKVFGYKEREILGKSGAILFTPEDREQGVPEREMHIALENDSAEDERWHIRQDNSRFYASGVMTRFKSGAGFVKIARDMTDKIKIQKALHDKEILQKLVGAQENERKRIARDLHDELGQLLTALRLKLEAVRKSCEDNAELCAKIDETQTLAKRVDNGVDFLAWELRPAALDDLGLVAALEKYVREWSHYSGVTAEFIGSAGTKKMRLASEAETNLYRIAQEALNNVHKHAKAKSVEISLEKRDADLIVLIIGDDGKGFDPQQTMKRSTGIGLIGMRERAALIKGSLEIESAPGKGTTVFVRVPASMVEKEISNDE